MINTAVILAAGLGSRISNRVKDKPKGFIELEGKPIIEMSIEKLLETGIREIIIGTGYLHGEYEKLAEKYPEIKCIYNPDYSTTGSLYTLCNLKESIKNDFILLESDLVYEKLALQILQHHSMEDILLVSEATNSHDEVFVEAKDNYCLANMSKNRDLLKRIDGELIGITKVSLNCFNLMYKWAENNFKNSLKLDYEQALSGVSNECNIYVNKIKDFSWCEIDDEAHLRRAITEVYPKIKNSESNMSYVKRNILLNPGPATTTNTVKYAQIVPDICPREKEFGELMKYISEELTKLAGDLSEYVTVLFGGSGTAAVEAMLTSVVGEGCLLIVNNGAYGKRMSEISKIHKLNYVEFKSSPYKAVDISELEKAIKASACKITHLSVIHSETTSGLLNDIEAIGSLCRSYNIDLLVDAMSSFAAVPINMKKMNISFLASSSNKNLQGMPGVSFVVCNVEKLENIKNQEPKSLYLNLYAQYKYFKENLQMRFTPPVQTLYALRQAIEELKSEGVENRYNRYCSSWRRLADGIEKLGLSYLVDEANHSKIVTTIMEPQCDSYSFDELHDYLYSHGITIYPGKVTDLKTFRVANIGSISEKDIELFLSLLEKYLLSIGYNSR